MGQAKRREKEIAELKKNNDKVFAAFGEHKDKFIAFNIGVDYPDGDYKQHGFACKRTDPKDYHDWNNMWKLVREGNKFLKNSIPHLDSQIVNALSTTDVITRSLINADAILSYKDEEHKQLLADIYMCVSQMMSKSFTPICGVFSKVDIRMNALNNPVLLIRHSYDKYISAWSEKSYIKVYDVNNNLIIDWNLNNTFGNVNCKAVTETAITEMLHSCV